MVAAKSKDCIGYVRFESAHPADMPAQRTAEKGHSQHFHLFTTTRIFKIFFMFSADMLVKGWIWKPIVAGSCGTIVHFLFMYIKTRTGLLPSFQPYHSLQIALGRWVGTTVPAIVPWALSFLNGMTILGFLFSRINRLLPGRNGATKGLIFGLIGWVMMGLIFFPLIGLGPFAFGIGLGIGPALLSLAMLLTYSVVMGTVYVALKSYDR